MLLLQSHVEVGRVPLVLVAGSGLHDQLGEGIDRLDVLPWSLLRVRLPRVSHGKRAGSDYRPLSTY